MAMEKAVKEGGRGGFFPGSRRGERRKGGAAMEESAGDGSSPSSSVAPPQRRLTVTQKDQIAVEGSVFGILRSLGDASVQTQEIT